MLLHGLSHDRYDALLNVFVQLIRPFFLRDCTVVRVRSLIAMLVLVLVDSRSMIDGGSLRHASPVFVNQEQKKRKSDLTHAVMYARKTHEM